MDGYEIEYLGRLDNQVQLRGFRIELGEIEARLNAHMNISDAVVRLHRKNDNSFIVAYYVTEQAIETVELREFLDKDLPDYMIPSYFVHLTELPLTFNGKLDNKALPDPEINSFDKYIAPSSDEEVLLCSIWNDVLGIDNISVSDNFFALGGDSIKSIQISARLRDKGFDLPVKEIFVTQTIRELAKRLKQLESSSEQSLVSGEAPLSPIQKWLFDLPIGKPEHFNQSVLLSFNKQLSSDKIKNVFHALIHHHDALRIRLSKDYNGYSLLNSVESNLWVEEFDLKSVDFHKSRIDTINSIQSSFDLTEGPLLKVAVFHHESGSDLLIVAHHLIIDGVSWRILFEDFSIAFEQDLRGEPINLPTKTDSFLKWSHLLTDYKTTDRFEAAKDYWDQFISDDMTSIIRDDQHAVSYRSDSEVASFTLSEKQTSQLLKEVNNAFNTGINDILLSALACSLSTVFNIPSAVIDIESHGRDLMPDDINVSRTIGWFTSICPVRLNGSCEDITTLIKNVKETIRKVPNRGLDYLLTEYASSDEFRAPICFNYLGQFDTDIASDNFEVVNDFHGYQKAQDDVPEYEWEVSGLINQGKLTITLTYGSKNYNRSTVCKFMSAYEKALSEIIAYCAPIQITTLTPSDMVYNELNIEQLEAMQQRFDVENVYPLAPTQEVMLFQHMLDPHAKHFVQQLSCCFSGNVNVEAVKASLVMLVNRYEIFRSTIFNEGYEAPIQLIAKQKELEFLEIDISEECRIKETKREVITSHKEAEKQRGFEVIGGDLMRFVLLKTGESEFTFLWNYHHILMDGWCMGIIFKEFLNLYESLTEGTDIELPDVKPYGDYLSWLQEKNQSEGLRHWQNQLSDYENLASLPQISQKDDLPGADEQESIYFAIPENTGKALNSTSKKYGVSLNTIFQTAWGVLLAKFNNTNDVVFGSVVSGRPSDIEGIENMVGLFINTIPVRVRYGIGEETLESLLTKLQSESLDNSNYHHLPLAEIQGEHELGNMLFNHIMIFENYPIDEKVTGGQRNSEIGLQVSDVESIDKTNYDLALIIFPGKEIKIKVDYAPSRYNKHMVEKAIQGWLELIDRITTEPEVTIDTISIVSSNEREVIINTFNNTLQADPAEGLSYSLLFGKQSIKTPNSIAVQHNSDHLTYRELYEKSARFADSLQESGVSKNEKIAIYMPRGIDMLVSILGVIHVGCAYVPIDVNYPEERVLNILENSEATKVIVAGEQRIKKSDIVKQKNNVDLIIDLSVIDLERYEVILPVDVSSDDLVYIIFTSGTTGKPKGVMIHSEGMINHLYAKIFDLKITAEDVIAQTASPCFDISVWQFLAALIVGGKTHIVDNHKVLETKELINELNVGEVSIFESVPSLITTFLDSLSENTKVGLKNLRWMVPTGEALSAALVKKWYHYFPSIPLVNAYGPTEASDDITHYIVPDNLEQSVIPVGKPVRNMHIYILDRYLNMCPIGVRGEICVAGVGVGKGYFNDPEKTNAVFVSNPVSETNSLAGFKTLYKTGDIGYFNEDGEVICLGRLDHQVKIRGNRIELGEIETVLLEQGNLSEAVIVVKEIRNEKHLIAYYLSEKLLDTVVLKEYLQSKLPGYMVPSYFIQLDKLPVTVNGKLDRKALPDPDEDIETSYIAPDNLIEEKLQAIWSEVLNLDLEQISVTASFFNLGGHSLKVTQLLNKINNQFEIELPLKEVYTKETIQNLADYLLTINQSLLEEDDSEVFEISI
ncbi:MAG: amino acid adenylation domain-containing protein [Cyclobacteriaceae bacterium]